MRNHSNENEFDLHENEPVGGTHFHMNGFALRLVYTQSQKVTLMSKKTDLWMDGWVDWKTERWTGGLMMEGLTDLRMKHFFLNKFDN